MRLDVRFIRTAALVAGPACAALVFVLLPQSFSGGSGDVVELGFSIRCVIALSSWMALWWISDVVPLPITALLPITLLPLFGVANFKQAAAPYAHPLIFLFFGGFLLSLAVQKWGLHKRFAISLLRRVGRDRSHLVGGFMLATALLSMWLSNTATTIMMLPIALSILTDDGPRDGFAPCLMLGIAYSASIGGMMTLIGTPPNIFIASYFADHFGFEIGFVQWMAIGVPCALVLLPLTWLYLTRVRYALDRSAPIVISRLDDGGPQWRDLDRGARATLIVFGCVVAAWVSRPLLGDVEVGGLKPFVHVSDAGIALLGAGALFVLPVELARKRFVLDWNDTKTIPWGTLILFGGGLSLAAAINATGVDHVFGQWVSRLPFISPLVLVVSIVALVILLTELTSNIATTASLVPVVAAAAPTLGLDSQVIVVLVALAASCAFMMPVATPPNAIVFGSGQISALDMARAGIVTNLLALIVIVGIAYALIPHVLR